MCCQIKSKTILLALERNRDGFQHPQVLFPIIGKVDPVFVGKSAGTWAARFKIWAERERNQRRWASEGLVRKSKDKEIVRPEDLAPFLQTQHKIGNIDLMESPYIVIAAD